MQYLFPKAGFYLGMLLGTASLPQAHGQAAPTAPPFKQPQLLEGGGQAGLVRAIQLGVRYPRAALRYGIQGQSQVTFIVAPDGQVQHVHITRGIQADMDTAVVMAVRQLPRLQPGTQGGKPVACILTAPVTFLIAPTKPSKKKLLAADSTQLYSAVAEMPFYKGHPGMGGLSQELVAGYLQLAEKKGCFVPHTNLGVLVTVGPNGTLYDWERIRTDDQEHNLLLAAYGDNVAHNDEEELPAACLELLAEASKSLPRLFPAVADGKRVAIRIQMTLLAP